MQWQGYSLRGSRPATVADDQPMKAASISASTVEQIPYSNHNESRPESRKALQSVAPTRARGFVKSSSDSALLLLPWRMSILISTGLNAFPLPLPHSR